MLEDGETEGAWPMASAGGEEPSPISQAEDRRFNVMMQLKAEIAQQEARVLASERARQESVQYVEQIAYDEINAMQDRIAHSDHQIRQQLETIQGQGLTIEEMTLEDEGATYRCEGLERMNTMAQEVAVHLKNRVISITEEFNAQGINAEEMYHQANHEIASLRRSLEAANHRYMIAQSELNAALEETAKQHARELYNKDLDRQELVRAHYTQESTQQGIILDLHQRLLNEESSLQTVRRKMFENRNEIHDMQLAYNEVVERNRSYESQLAIQDRVKSEMVQGQALSWETVDRAFPILASEIHGLKEALIQRDEKIHQQRLIMEQYAKDDQDRALSNDGNESILRMQQLADRQGGQIERMSTRVRDTEEYNKELISHMEALRTFQGPNRSVDLGKVQDMKDAYENRIHEIEGRLKIVSADYSCKVRMVDELVERKSSCVMKLMMPKVKP